jgi:AhpD family alkylhydroperoxidase
MRMFAAGGDATIPWRRFPRTEDDMQARLDAFKAAPGGYKALAGLQAYVDASGLEKPLLELVKIRASQINGCAFCIAMHVREARELGESDERMHLLNAWREAPIYSAREQAALAWAEAVTLVTEGHVDDAVYENARRQFSDKELADLTLAVIAINAWNRMAIAFREAPEVTASRAA